MVCFRSLPSDADAEGMADGQADRRGFNASVRDWSTAIAQSIRKELRSRRRRLFWSNDAVREFLYLGLDQQNAGTGTQSGSLSQLYAGSKARRSSHRDKRMITADAPRMHARVLLLRSGIWSWRRGLT